MKVTVLPEQYSGDPEAVAMMQAFYSRSRQPIAERLADLGSDLTSVNFDLPKRCIQFYSSFRNKLHHTSTS